MKKLRPAHIVFINGMVTHGNRIRAYMEAYPRSAPASAKANACRLLKNEVIKQRLDHYEEMRQLRHERKIVEEIQSIYTDFVDSQQQLVEIAKAMPVQKTTVSGEIILAIPTVTEQLNAISALMRNQRKFVQKHPEYASWFEKDTTALPLIARQQRLSKYMAGVSPVSLYRKGIQAVCCRFSQFKNDRNRQQKLSFWASA